MNSDFVLGAHKEKKKKTATVPANLDILQSSTENIHSDILSNEIKSMKIKSSKSVVMEFDPEVIATEALALEEVETKKSKKKGKKGKGDGGILDDASDGHGGMLDDNEVREEAGEEAISSKNRKKKKGKLTVVEEMELVDSLQPVHFKSVNDSVEQPVVKETKKKKKKVEIDEDVTENTEVAEFVEQEVSKKKKSKAKQAVEVHENDKEDIIDVSEEVVVLKGEKKKKKSKKESAEEEQRFEEQAVEDGLEVVKKKSNKLDADEVLNEEFEEKPKKKKKSKRVYEYVEEVVEEEIIEEVVEEEIIEEVVEEEQPAPVEAIEINKGKKKGRGKADEEIDKILAELEKPKETVEPAGPSKTQLKKMRQAEREAEAAKAAASGVVQPTEPVVAKKDKKEKEKELVDVGKKIPTHIRLIQEQMAKQKEAEEQQKLAEIEQQKREAEERQRALEEEARLKALEEQKREEKKKREAELKKQGLYLTAAQKAKQHKDRMALEQMIKAGAITISGLDKSEAGSKPPRNALAKKKKDKPVVASESIVPPVSNVVANAPALVATPANDDGDWEKVVDEMESNQVVAAPPMITEKASQLEDASDDDWEAVVDALGAKKDAVKSIAPAITKTGEKKTDVKGDLNVGVKSDTKVSAAVQAKVETKANSKIDTKKKDEKREIRSPICCILGHVDTGKTKILDRIRHTNVQSMEAGGITQQIGATFVPVSALRDQTSQLMANLKKELDFKLPGLLIIDTPGHESFSNLRSRGSGLCDIAVLVIDLMHGIEPQTLESINLLKMRKTPFIVALNKIDRCFGWKVNENFPFLETLGLQNQACVSEFESRAADAMLQLNQQGLNCELYYKNKDFRKYVSLVPTSAITGEGIPDLLMLITQLTQQMMAEKLTYLADLQCTILEVKTTDGFGYTIDVILVNGMLHVNDTIVVCGLNGPIVTKIRSLLTPQPLKELRVKSDYIHHQEVKAALGVKVAAHDLEYAVAGSPLFVCKNPSNSLELEQLKDEVMADLASIYSKVAKVEKGVWVQASTLGSLEALLSFLGEMKIPVSGVGIGNVHKKEVMKASTQLERQVEYATILAFDVKIVPEALQIAEHMGVRIFTADIIYHLFDMFTKYMEEIRNNKRAAVANDAVFPCVLEILPNCIFNSKSPLIVGVLVKEGIVKIGTPICVPTKEFLYLGKVVSIEDNHVPRQSAKKDDRVCVSIEMENKYDQQPLYGRHYDLKNLLVSKISRQSIDLLKENFKDDLTQDDWKLVVKLKKEFEIM